MPIARVYDPAGTLIGEHVRPSGRRAALSAKGAQVRHRRLTEVDFELVYDYSPGTKVVTDNVTETWDGALWVDQSTGLPSEPIAPGTRFSIGAVPHVYTDGLWVPVEPPKQAKKRGEG